MLQQFLCLIANAGLDWVELRRMVGQERCSAERRPSSINFAWALEKIEVKLR